MERLAEVCKPNCPPLEDWPVIASVRSWSDNGEAGLGWKVLRKCPNCSNIIEQMEEEA